MLVVRRSIVHFTALGKVVHFGVQLSQDFAPSSDLSRTVRILILPRPRNLKIWGKLLTKSVRLSKWKTWFTSSRLGARGNRKETGPLAEKSALPGYVYVVTSRLYNNNVALMVS